MKKLPPRPQQGRRRTETLAPPEVKSSAVEIQVAAMPVRRKKGTHQVLMVTSSNREWILPKGNRSTRLTDAEAAAREALEEAGVSGTINTEALGSYLHRQANGNRKRVIVFELPVEKVTGRWREKGKRKRGWLPLDVACRSTKQIGLRRLLRKLQSRLAPIAKP
jgi:8-oxo-dGTP pyrophosphatase MutT (NUDIX family)